MKSRYLRLAVMSLFALGLVGSIPTGAAEPATGRAAPTFGSIKAPSLEAVRAQAQDWLKSTGKFDQAAFDAIWAQTDRPVIDLVADTFALGSPEAKQLLADARDPNAPAPMQVPEILKDTKLPVFFRSNLALAYAKALSTRKVYEEALEALKPVKAEQVVDPGAFFFHKAVVEHGTLHKADATKSIAQLLDNVPEAPERYKMVAALMFLDMQEWKEKDLGDIGRKMSNIERRLELARGGPQTQKMQKEVVMRLDELIKKLENQAKQQQGQGQGQGEPKDGPGCPPGGQPGQGQGQGQGQAAGAPTAPQTDSFGGQNKGPGNVDPKKLRETVEAWGKLPEKERAKAMTEMIRTMPPAYRQMIEEYYRKGAGGSVEGR
jgi:hypothetical protein